MLGAGLLLGTDLFLLGELLAADFVSADRGLAGDLFLLGDRVVSEERVPWPPLRAQARDETPAEWPAPESGFRARR